MDEQRRILLVKDDPKSTTPMKNKLDFLMGLGRLIRLPNLLIIILTQYLLRFSILEPFLYQDAGVVPSSLLDFSLLVLVTVLIAAGGYIINDYFDVKIDAVNKPDHLTIDKLVPARKAIAVHLILNGIAILIGFYLAYRVHSFTFGLIFPFISLLLWFYSASYKRMFVWGNLIVAFLSAFVILVVWLFEFFALRADAESFAALVPHFRIISRIFLAYALFAFLVSLFREIVKDMEDSRGDERYGCRTLPLVLGMRTTRYIALGLLILNIALLSYGMVILYRLDFLWAFWYFLALVQLPVLYLIIVLMKATEKQDFHHASTITKLIMLTGILSMQVLSLTF